MPNPGILKSFLYAETGRYYMGRDATCTHFRYDLLGCPEMSQSGRQGPSLDLKCFPDNQLQD